jgi:hypothetical protein
MSQVHQVTGQLTDNRHVTLDEPIPLNAGKVRLIVEAIENGPRPDLEAFEQRLRERQRARRHLPRTKEEIDAYLNSERNSWDS